MCGKLAKNCTPAPLAHCCYTTKAAASLGSCSRGTRKQNGDPHKSRPPRSPLHKQGCLCLSKNYDVSIGPDGHRDGAERVVVGTSAGVAHAPGDAVHRDDERVLQLLLLQVVAELAVAEAVQDMRLEPTHARASREGG